MWHSYAISHGTQEVSVIRMTPKWASFSLVFNMPRSANHEKISIRNGIRPPQNPLIGSRIKRLVDLANSKPKFLTENDPDLSVIQMS